MGMFDDELILPGTSTEIESDYNLGYDMSKWDTTDSVTIIGTAFNGPVGKAVPVYSPEYASYIFGGSYDETTRREATLTAEIKDAWDRGCRTIYAVRISGQEIYKDFELVPETKMKLRVSGFFPSNANKDVYMVYDNTPGAEKINIYKPAERATIAEKQTGMVEDSNSILVISLDIANTFGFTRDSKLVELINVVNEYSYNNVLKLTIVDEEGNDITISSKDAQALSVGAIFPGAYFIGRDKNLGTAYTDVQYRFVDGDKKPYANFSDNVYKDLIINTDIKAAYPIYAPSKDAFNSKLPVVMLEMFDFLSVPKKVDEVFAKDEIDYEEVDLPDFEIYKRLGKGYAITAKAETYVAADGSIKIKKVKETPTSDANRVQPINDGIYSMLENLVSDYRVLTCGNTDTVITGKLPKKSDFEIMTSKSITFDDLIEVESIIDKHDFSAAKNYTFQIMATNNTINGSSLIGDTFTDKIVKAISFASEDEIGIKTTIPEGSIVFAGLKVCRVTGGILTEVDPATNQTMDGMLVFGRELNATSSENKIFKIIVPNGVTIINNVVDTEPIPPVDTEPAPPVDTEPAPPVDTEPTPPVDTEPTPPQPSYVTYEVATAEDVKNKKYVFVESDNTVYVYAIPEDTSGPAIPDVPTDPPTPSDPVDPNDPNTGGGTNPDPNDPNAGGGTTDPNAPSGGTGGTTPDPNAPSGGTTDPNNPDSGTTDPNNPDSGTTDPNAPSGGTGGTTDPNNPDGSGTTDPDAGGNSGTTPDPGQVPGTAAIVGQLVGLVSIGSVNEVFNDNEDKTLVTIQTQHGTQNNITIMSTEFDYCTIEEFVDILNEDENLKKYFTFRLTTNGTINKDELIYDVFGLDVAPYVAVMDSDRVKTYDTSLYIPYRTTDNFARHLAQHCTYTSLKTAPTHGVIGCTKLKNTNLTSIANKVNELLALDLNLFLKKENGKDKLDQNNLQYPIGRNISIVLGQYSFSTVDNHTYISNGVSGYAAMVSCLDLEQSSTNQPINIPSPMYELTNHQLGKLTQKGFVTFKQSYTKGYVVTDGVTMAPATSAFKRLSVTRISHAVEEAIRTATEPYIGKQNHLANRNAMQTAIKSGLEALKGTLIEAYSFEMQTNNRNAEKLGIVYINYKIVPIYEIREVRNVISVGDSTE